MLDIKFLRENAKLVEKSEKKRGKDGTLPKHVLEYDEKWRAGLKKVEKLKQLWSKGHTASQIAEALGDTTRNAVIGKAHRLNLSAKIKTRTATSNQNFEMNLAIG